MLVKAGGTGWHSGASSQQFIQSDGAVDFTVQSNDDTLVAGFSKNKIKGDYKRIDFAIFLSANGGLYVYEHGFNKGNFGNYHKKDTFRIERQGSKVTYSRNCQPFYVSKQPSSGQLMTAVSLYSRGARISHAIMYGASQ